MNRAETIQKAKANWKRQANDWYPTPPEVTRALLIWMHKHDMLTRKLILKVHEPCCGEGHVSRVLEQWPSLHVTSHDLNDTGYGISGVDYLRTPERDPKRYDYDMVITNPPFSLAERFIRRALRDAPVVAMFLPTDYWHAKTRAHLFRSRPPRALLALTWRPVFLAEERGSSPLANYAWSIWDDRHNGPTEYHLLSKP